MEKIDWGSLGFGYIKTDYRYVSNYRNGIVLAVKTILNMMIITLVSSGKLKSDVAMYLLPLASGISFGIVTVFALRQLFSKKNPYHVKWEKSIFNKNLLIQLSQLSFPVFLEKFLIPFGIVC